MTFNKQLANKWSFLFSFDRDYRDLRDNAPRNPNEALYGPGTTTGRGSPQSNQRVVQSADHTSRATARASSEICSRRRAAASRSPRRCSSPPVNPAFRARRDVRHEARALRARRDTLDALGGVVRELRAGLAGPLFALLPGDGLAGQVDYDYELKRAEYQGGVNQRKADRLRHEAGLKLLSIPRAPKDASGRPDGRYRPTKDRRPSRGFT